MIYLILFMWMCLCFCFCFCFCLGKHTISTQDSMKRTPSVLGGKTHRLFQLPRHLQEGMSVLSRDLPNRHLELLFIARDMVQDASDIETHFCRQGLSRPAAATVAASLKQWFDHCCDLAGMPAGILKMHTSTTPGPRWHTDLNLSWLHDLGQDLGQDLGLSQPQFKFGCTVRGDGTLLMDLHPMLNHLFQWLELNMKSIKTSNAFALVGHVHTCPPGSMVAWSIAHGGNALGLRQVHSEAVNNKTHNGKNRVFVQVLPCTRENAISFKNKDKKI